MKTSILITVIAIILVILVGGYLLIQNNNAPTPSPTPTPTPNPPINPTPNPTPNTTLTPTTKNIKIIEFAFMPKTLKIKVGDTVIWTNSDTTPHTITSNSGTELSSSTLAVGQTYSHTFNTNGTFPYHCTIHSMMKANIVVQ